VTAAHVLLEQLVCFAQRFGQLICQGLKGGDALTQANDLIGGFIHALFELRDDVPTWLPLGFPTQPFE
jgi:hypothetical protein